MSTKSPSEDRPKRAVIYLRSASAQPVRHRVRPRKGALLREQAAACTYKAKEMGADIVGVYTDRGASARAAKWPQFRAMVKRVTKDRDVDYVITQRPASLNRTFQGSVSLRVRLMRADCRLISADIFNDLAELIYHSITEMQLDSHAEATIQDENHAREARHEDVER